MNSICCGAPLLGGVQCEVCGADGRPSNPEWGRQLTCPFCEDPYIHFNPAKYQSSDSYSAWEGRGHALRVPFYCEQGHSWYLRYGSHKGHTFVKVERVYDQDFSGNTIDF